MILWYNIEELPADGKIYDGADCGAELVRHIPATVMHVEQLLALKPDGLRRRMRIRNGKWGSADLIGGTIGDTK